MQFLRLVLLAVLLAPAPGISAENKYDVLAKALTPFVNVFAKQTKNPNRALRLAVRLESMTDLPEAFAGARAELALEYPDKVRLHGPVLGEELTIVRRGQTLWVAPGSAADAALKAAVSAKKLPPEDHTFRLEPFTLPVPEKQLVFLPTLFRVQDAGSELLDGELCRVLDLQLVPEAARSLKEPGWSARLWVRADGKPARLTVQRPAWQIAVRLESVEFSKALPETTWEPSSEEAGDVLEVSPARYQQLLKALVK